MSPTLINRNDDLKRLRDTGYEVEVTHGHLIVHSIPYVKSNREIAYGSLVSVLELHGDQTGSPILDHIAYFTGEQPCNSDGSIIKQIEHSVAARTIVPGLTVQRSFSNKPQGGYIDYYDKMARYITIMSNAAKAINAEVTAQTYKLIESDDEDGVFLYQDSASSRAGIAAISDKLKQTKIAIIGLGGTGSWVLDLASKTPVREIHLFDGDKFLQHNAFRSPSAAPKETFLGVAPSKVSYWAELYGRFRRGIVPNETYVTDENLGVLDGFDFVFICVDKGYARRQIIDGLLARSIPFIDTGMGVYIQDQSLDLYGMCRVTLGTPEKNDHLNGRVPMGDDFNIDDAYVRNIQVADLNALNATLAVIKWKKHCGFYQDFGKECSITYSINDNLLANDDRT